ncbi:uncharacterized protein LOC124264780 [Haliotis rubra]|uniref:uncharacterized protein LOC124264780 n=1 Tax=Haliotis rubra TaxID=36100 RepID=UPI001EE5F66E|nr:uncharacterized protein LOC124264780 [Haliotis rubra]
MSSVWWSWLPGFNGGHPQTFLIEYLQSGTRKWTVYNSNDDKGERMVVDVTGLISGEIYTFRLLAKNDYGDMSLQHLKLLGIHKQKLETPSTSTGVTAGAVVGGILITLLIVGIVLTVLYRNGYRCRNIKGIPNLWKWTTEDIHH